MDFTQYDPITRDEADAILREAANVGPLKFVSAGVIGPPVVDGHDDAERLTPTERAKLRGWSIDPAITPGNPHELNGCPCRRRRVTDDPAIRCNCACHGRTYVHYKRGA